jgi:hypothetical protein
MPRMKKGYVLQLTVLVVRHPRDMALHGGPGLLVLVHQGGQGVPAPRSWVTPSSNRTASMQRTLADHLPKHRATRESSRIWRVSHPFLHDKVLQAAARALTSFGLGHSPRQKLCHPSATHKTRAQREIGYAGSQNAGTSFHARKVLVHCCTTCKAANTV